MVKAAQDLGDQQSATVTGGVQAAGLGMGAALGAGFAARQFKVPAYNALTLPLKALAVTAVGLASFSIGADHAAREFELSKYAVGSGTKLERESRLALEQEKKAGILQGVRADSRNDLSTKDLLVEWGKSHRYSVVFGAWAASMVGSFGYISMTPLSFAQKLVQARMVAQGLTVVVLIASAGLSAIPNAQGVNEDQVKREAREDSMYKWKSDSPHVKTHPHGVAADATATAPRSGAESSSGPHGAKL